MKVAFFVEEGREQVILTPETASEKSIISRMHDGTRVISILKGEFYRCQGGWSRQGSSEDSTILVLDKKEDHNAKAQDNPFEESE